jgi:hypothetical protein
MDNSYANFLESAGISIIEVDGVMWQNYKGILVPAYLPHCMPARLPETARKALSRSGAMIVRWSTEFDLGNNGEWWYVNRSGTYDRAGLSSNTRSKISRGMKKLAVRKMLAAELEVAGYEVCKAAVKRYGRDEFLPTYFDFEKKISAASAHPECIEFWGVFYQEKLIGFSENHIQCEAVFMESIWYDPDYLGLYSSYSLMDAILNEYLNYRKFKYVSDGSRSIYHETGVHDFLIEKFGFRRAYSKLWLGYSPIFSAALALAKWMEPVITKIDDYFDSSVLKKTMAVLRQDKMRD